MSSVEQAPTRFPALDGWRGVCAVLVVLYHIHVDWHGVGLPLVRHAFCLVDLFFVLSGFVLAHGWGERMGAPRGAAAFLLARLVRLYPLYLVVLGGFVGLQALALAVQAAGVALPRPAFSGPYGLPALAANLMLLNAVGLFDMLTWNGPGWSIGAEAVAALALVALARVPAAWRTAAMALAAALCLGMVMARSDTGYDVSHTLGAWRGTAGVLAGAVAYRVRSAVRLAGTAWEVAAVVALTLFVVGDTRGPLSWMAPVLCAWVVLVFAAGAGRVSRLLGWALVQLVGRLSYAIYLVHGLLLAGLDNGARVLASALHRPLVETRLVEGGELPLLVGPPWAMDALVALVLVIVLGLALAAERWIERPARRMLRARATTLATADRAGSPGGSPRATVPV